MTSGGARNRSGRSKDENSGRSERSGYSLTALPAEGFSGPAPEFPLPRRVVINEYFVEKRRIRELDDDATESVAEREAVLWSWIWRTPQACAWSMPSEAWRIHSVAMWVRTAVLCESSDATAADKNSLHRFADQIGMTTAGLRELGWKVAVDEVAAKAAAKESEGNAEAPKRERRLREAK